MIYLTLFMIGGAAYNILEYIWRGYSHWTMAIDGGICLIGIFAICTKSDINFIYKVLASSLLITTVEFISGLIINKAFKLNVWDYSNVPYNIMGQICPRYSILWTALCIPIVAAFTLIEKNMNL
ncbi:MAG: hypothetical protein IJ365_06815 [Clostridia bacterium]|nr:hypothetical protein [Clostridia bacterium]